MHKISDWLNIHNAHEDCVARILSPLLAAVKSPGLRMLAGAASSPQINLPSCGSQEDCLKKIIFPSFSDRLLGCSEVEDAISRIAYKIGASGTQPHTLDEGVGSEPTVVMEWNGKVSDLICLAHETAHALQIILSGHGQTPPVARETCAFLGEIALLDWAKQSESELFLALATVWNQENRRYLAVDTKDLLDALNDPNARYNYRWNYPLARLAAIEIFESDGWINVSRMFQVGPTTMKFLPLDHCARRTLTSSNPLPPMPEPSTESSADNAYRALGAMVALDLKNSRDEAQTPIGTYYAELRDCMKDKQAFLVLADDRRPAGYATWQGYAVETGSINFSREVALFCGQDELRQTVAQHLTHGSGNRNDKSITSGGRVA